MEVIYEWDEWRSGRIYYRLLEPSGRLEIRRGRGGEWTEHYLNKRCTAVLRELVALAREHQRRAHA
jgi:hypothetical protein